CAPAALSVTHRAQADSEMENRAMSFASWIRTLNSVPARSRITRKCPPLRRRAATLSLECLEDRLAPAVLTVNTAADNTSYTSGRTLGEAIPLVNNAGDPASLGQSSMPAGWAAQIDTTSPFGSTDTINFNIPTSDPAYQTQGSTTWFSIAPL